ncbi:MAG: restriction endonuclease subunit S [Gammaproteobacteria bacterium]|nr:MAG: restriction endonuclease subunit S [Gammaproteobacteria bacterium]
MKNGWERKPFENCIEPVVYTRKVQRKDFLNEGQFPIVSQEAEFTNGYWNDEADVFKVSTPVVIFGDHTQVLKYVDFDFVLGADGVKILQPRSFLRPKFLFYQLQAAELASLGYARHYRLLKELEIKVPPLPEQQRIVGLLDETFSGIATAQANAGKNLQNARSLFESHLQSVFTQRGAKWDRVTLQTLLDRRWIECHLDGNHGSDYPRKDEFISVGVPYISANCLDDEHIDMSRAKYLSPSRAAQLRKGIAKDNDVLFAHNATVGPVAILHTDEEKVILGTSLTYYRCDPKHILPEYLAHYMRSFGFKSQYLQVMKQSTRNQVPITKQREFFHVIPPLEEQKLIVGALDGLLENGQRLAHIYERKLAALEALKKSLLHQAFTGEL